MIVRIQYRRARFARARRPQQGFTLVELLLAVSILVVLTTFFAGAFSVSRRALDIDKLNRSRVMTDEGLQLLARLIGGAMPVRKNGGPGPGSVNFAGRSDAFRFVSLSEGRSLKGGPQLMTVRKKAGELVVEIKSAPAAPNNAANSPAAAIVLRGIRDVRFGYFGKVDPSRPPSWRSDWAGLEQLPDLVSIKLEFEDRRRSEPPRIVALRQH